MMTGDSKLKMYNGLNVTFDSDKYRLMMPYSDKEYPVGGLICEYLRLAPADIKRIIMECESREKEASEENFIDAFMQFTERLNAELPPVTSAMIALEFFVTAEDWFSACRSDRRAEFIRLLESGSDDSARAFVLQDSGCSEFGGDSVLQLLLSCYCGFISKYAVTKSMFTRLMESDEIRDDEHERSIKVLVPLYRDYMDMQHIDYRLVLTDRGLESLYTVKSSISLLLFEMAHCINGEVNIQKCRNCGNYFVPEGRSNTVYCSYPIRGDQGKTCRDVGAQIARTNKEKNDAATKAYRKVYMRYKQNLNRHPDDTEAAARFDKLTNEVRDWRKKMAQDEASEKEFLEWLEQF